MPGDDLFSGSVTAAGYARHRPPVHRVVLAEAALRLGLSGPVRTALDVGSGAGASTAALQPWANRCIAIDPSAAMVEATAAEGAHTVRATAEHLPLRPASIDLVTAAGSLNGADLPRSLGEIARVLRPGGAFVAYDFSLGRRTAGSAALDNWAGGFLVRWPRPAGRWPPLDTARLVHPDLIPVHDGTLEAPLPMTREAYVDYLMTESNVTAALARGTAPEEIREWCAATLPTAFGPSEDVIFDATLTCATRR